MRLLIIVVHFEVLSPGYLYLQVNNQNSDIVKLKHLHINQLSKFLIPPDNTGMSIGCIILPQNPLKLPKLNSICWEVEFPECGLHTNDRHFVLGQLLICHCCCPGCLYLGFGLNVGFTLHGLCGLQKLNHKATSISAILIGAKLGALHMLHCFC